MQKFLGYLALGIGGAAVLAGMIALGAILNGWVLSWLWLWFLVPLGLAPIGVIHAIGIASIVGYLTKQRQKSDKEDAAEAFIYALLAPFFALGFGWIIYLFM